MTVPRVLFVCTGNLCRSPLAAGLFAARCGTRLSTAWTVDSAGLHAREGLAPAAPAIAVAEEHGVDISAKRSRCFVHEDFARFDHIVAMDRGHLDFLSATCPPAYRGRIALLEDERGQPIEVPDPYGRPLRAFRHAAQLLVTGIAVLLEDLEKEGSGSRT
ncbi:MAG: low molecular weight protein-tyrosine-phosphatase [Gammaproteobacteria bacterium]